MRILILLSLFCFVLFSSCKKQGGGEKPSQILIRVHIENANPGEVITIADLEIEVELNKSGVGILDIDTDTKKIVTINYFDEEIFVFAEPGDKIELLSNSDNFIGSATVSGDHSLENNFLLTYMQGVLLYDGDGLTSVYEKQENEFIATVEQKRNHFIAEIQEYQKQNGIFDDFVVDFLSLDMTYRTAVLKLNYPFMHKYFSNNDSFEVSDTYYSFFQNLELDNEDNLINPTFKYFLKLYLDYLVNQKLEPENKNSIKIIADVKSEMIREVFKETKIRNYLYFVQMENLLEASSYNVASEYYDDYLKNQNDTSLKKKIEIQFQEVKHLVQGEKALDLGGSDLEGNYVKVNNLSGKLVYIDVWATWCGPCLHEIPFLEKLENEYAYKNQIAFVSISVDEDKKAWETMIKSKNMKGLQLFEENNWEAEWLGDYKIIGIPRFILLDREGKIIDANAPRPSSPELKMLIDQHL